MKRKVNKILWSWFLEIGKGKSVKMLGMGKNDIDKIVSKRTQRVDASIICGI
jgi:hypothetical protein